MNMTKIAIDGAAYDAASIRLGAAPLLVICGGRGALGCGYLNVETAGKLGYPLAIVTGVGDFDAMLQASVRLVSPAAAALGVAPGMSGREALKLLK